jgi:hypothetical protein
LPTTPFSKYKVYTYITGKYFRENKRFTCERDRFACEEVINSDSISGAVPITGLYFPSYKE